MAKKKITQLDPATSVNSDAFFPLSQEDNNEEKTFKGTIEQLGDYINKSQDFNTLNTTSKKVIGAINEVLRASGSDIITTIDTPASVMTFNDGGDNIPVNKLLVAVTATQSGSGTPSPSNPRAISGWSGANITRCGKNFYPVKVGRDLFADNRGSTHTTNDDILTITMASENNSGVYGGTGTASNNAICQTIKKFSGSFVFSLYAKASANNSDVYFGFGSFGNTVVTLSTSWQRVELPLTLDSAIHTLNFYNRSGSAITVDIKDVQIEQALSTATPYEAYKGITVVIPFGDTYYSGVLDVTNGKLTITQKAVDMGSLSWTYSTTAASFFAPLSDAITPVATGDENAICSCYLRDDPPNNAGIVNLTFFISDNSISSVKRVFVCDSSYNGDAAAFTTGVTGQTLVYTLETPIVIDLSIADILSTLSGLNNIYADCGDIQELEYFNENADEIAELHRSMSDDFHIYSTAEQIVGKWLGEDLYEKSYHYTQNTVPSQSTAVVIDSDVSGLNIASVAMIYCIFKIHHISDNYDFWLNDASTNTQILNNQLLFYQNGTQSQSNYNNLEVNITIRYTKAS